MFESTKTTNKNSVPSPLTPGPLAAGIGARDPHLKTLLIEEVPVPWLELLADNWLSSGGYSANTATQLGEKYPVALHGVGLSIGSTTPLNIDYLQAIKNLIKRTKAIRYSEHLSFSQVEQAFVPDLLPMPYTEESLQHLVQRIDHVQDFLGQPLLIENVSSYAQFSVDTLTEADFIHELLSRTGALLLLDVNNLYVNQVNLGRCAKTALTKLPLHKVAEIHLAGFDDRGEYLVDTHSCQVSEPVWDLYDSVLQQTGPVPTLIEWDSDIPVLSVLLEEAARAQSVLSAYSKSGFE